MLTLCQTSGLDKQKSTNQLKYEAKGHTLYPRKMRKALGNNNKTISDGGITVDFWFIKIHTSN